jgi:hypothetical protein
VRPQLLYIFPFLLTFAVLTVSCSERGMFGGGEAGATIEQHGAAISKPIPNVTVFVPRTSTDREKQFGDEQLRAIVPAMKELDKFSALNVSGSSVTDAGIGHLTTLTELERLDVYETAVTVDGLMQLQHLPKLTFIAISRGKYSDKALAKLKGAFPKATILEVGRPTTTATRPAASPNIALDRSGRTSS